jgi:hypothetical protein
MKTARLPILLVAAISIGCGTLCNFAAGIRHPDSEPSVYGGVRRDMDFVTELASSRPAQCEAGPDKETVTAALVCVGLVGAEMAASFCTDTATLPITVALQTKRVEARKREARRAETTCPKADVPPGGEKPADGSASEHKPSEDREP